MSISGYRSNRNGGIFIVVQKYKRNSYFDKQKGGQCICLKESNKYGFIRYADDFVRHEARDVHGARAPATHRRVVSLSP